MAQQNDDMLDELATALGIASSYRGQNGDIIETSVDARRGLIEGLGFSTRSQSDLRDGLDSVSGYRSGPLAPWMVIESGRPQALSLKAAFAETITGWSLRGENALPQSRKEDGQVRLPSLASGYYRLDIESGASTASTFLLVAPPRCWSPDALRSDGARAWGLAAQVYGLKSARNFGMGDLTDVAQLATGAGRCGASFLGLSPLHALFEDDRTKISPYSPSTRLFLETLYLDPAVIDVPGIDSAGELAKIAPRMEAMRSRGLVDYAGVWDLKRPLLEHLFKAFQRTGDQEEFARRRSELGEQLELHATFEALSAHFSAEGQAWPGAWPSDYFDASSTAVQRFRREKADRVSFHAWLQTICDAQLAAAAEAARSSGMEVGLYRDLAVGADRFGSEVWARPDRYALSLSVGAPPDPLGPQGQNWGFPPFDPLALERQEFAAFRDLVVANMRHAGAIRIDHAFQLERLFLIPPGATAAGGAYVAFPFQALLAILRIESERHRCLVIAEDLGTGPSGFSDAIMESGIYSYRLLSFERSRDGGFLSPEAYPRHALAAITTHDLPTFKGWRRGFDIDLRSCFGVYNEKIAQAEHRGRKQDVAAWQAALEGQGLSGDLDEDETARNEALRYLARAPSALLAIQCEDVLDELNQANLPGPSDGHPNWRRKLCGTVEDMVVPGGPLARVGALLAEEERSPRARQSRLSSSPPRATYRLQFHKDFTFAAAIEILPYLAALGISHVYASPIQQAQHSSMHGYDVVDPRVINPELGGEEGFDAFVEALHANGLRLLLDIVPNHMGIGADNPFWFSVLKWGARSPYAHVFDIDLQRDGANGKIILPFLSSAYGEALESGALSLGVAAERGAIVIKHFDAEFPICPLDYAFLLKDAAARIAPDSSAGTALGRLAGAYLRIADKPDVVARAVSLQRGFTALVSEERVASALDATLREVAVDTEAFDALISRQAYRLAHWRLAGSEVNYRRFFEINALAGVRVEDRRVFDLTHELILKLVADGKVDGLRIDHIDGLADPAGYLAMLQAAVGPGFYIVAEKILEPGERLRDWPIAGTTGYDALNEIDAMLLNRSAAGAIQRAYRDVVGQRQSYHEALIAAKQMVLARSFGSETTAIVADLSSIATSSRRTRDIGEAALRRALIGYVVAIPVYRTYVGVSGADATDRAMVAQALADAEAFVEAGDGDALALLGRVLVGDLNDAQPDLTARVRQRVEQLTGPVMAKSLEDTLFYRYVPFLALNEVGSDPAQFGISRDGFDEAARWRSCEWPGSMIATATHDTKRGEDARARLLALTADPEEWCSRMERFLTSTDGPDANDRMLVFQALVGAWPLELLEAEPDQIEAFRERFEGFLIKALREAKRHSSWTDPDEAYEQRAKDFLKTVHTPESQSFELLREEVARVAFAGALNGLARTILKATLPGVPDFYQGTEYWDFSLVDPDNRRPVDYAMRALSLEATRAASPRSLLLQWHDGRIKQFIAARLLADRKLRPDLYAYGSYLTAKSLPGIAYERVLGAERLFVCTLTGTNLMERKLIADPGSMDAEIWGNARLKLAPGQWRNLLTGAALDSQEEVAISQVAEGLPFLILGTVA
ncbi:MAG: 4-alpha-glucanotransferase [Hyphomicrobiales bacterium]|nr:4-alpha-glucanotransferase [Hyphomicrobiales bacterium]